MGNGNNNAPSQTPMLLLGGLVLLLILLCCSSIFLSYSRTGNINIFSSSKEFTPEELAYAQAHGGAMPPGSSSSMSGTGGSALGLLDAFGVKQNCKVGPWSDWGACDANCGTTAHRTRTRQVVTPAKNGGSCPDPLIESDLCTGLPSCEVPAINGQYEPCPSGSYLLDAYCAVEIPHLTSAQCEDMKQKAFLGAVSLGAAQGGHVDPEQAAIVGAAVGGTMLAAGGGAAIVAGPALILTAGIMAAVAAAEVDCDAYVCPRGWHDTAVSRRCDKEATPKCPPGGYTWDWTRRMCIMPSTGSLAPAPSPH
jgi:hypothetical protein